MKKEKINTIIKSMLTLTMSVLILTQGVIINKSRKTLNKLKDSYSSMQEEVQEQSNELNSLNEKITELEGVINSKDEELQNKDEELAEKDNTISSLEEENKELARRKLEKEKQEKEQIGNKNGQVINVELTGYCNCSSCSGGWSHQAAMGTSTRVGVIAAPTSIPLGSKIYIPELGWYKEDATFSVEDRGGAVVERNGVYVIDVYFPSHEQAINFGRVKTQATIID